MFSKSCLCLALALLHVSCAATPRNKPMALANDEIARAADSSEEALLEVVSQIKLRTKLRLKLQGQQEYSDGEFSHTDSQYMFLESPTDTLEILHIREVWKSSDAPGYAVMTGAIVGGILGAMMGMSEGYSGIGIMVGVGLGLLVTYPASFSIPAWQ